MDIPAGRLLLVHAVDIVVHWARKWLCWTWLVFEGRGDESGTGRT